MKYFFAITFFLVTLLNSVAGAEKSSFQKATFAGGCFWCMEPPFEKLPGVKEVISGYMGGQKLNPTYEEVSAGETGHAECVQVIFDSSKITYEKLLDVFWRNIDPTTLNSQFVDIGSQYRTAIFYHDDKQKSLANESKEKQDKSKKFKSKIVTEVSAASVFYKAEEYHQDYYKKSPVRYKYYRFNSGRDQYLEKLWGSKD